MSGADGAERLIRELELESAYESDDVPRVPRFGHGSRVPGWDRAADLDKDPAEIPDPERVEVPPALREEIELHMSHYPDRRSAALPALAAAQRVHGWCSPEAIEQVACVMRVTPAYLESLSGFYDMLETSPAGRHSVYVCTNISCSLRGADALYEATARAVEGDENVNVRSFECLGACDIAPMASVDGVYVGPLSPEDVPAMLEDIHAGRDVLPEKQLARRLVADPHANSREFPEHPVHRLTIPGIDPEIPAERAAFGPVADEDRGEQTAPLEPQPEHGEEDKS
ncbi:MAG TPA: NAD(P)H-dependent oxidoreductase subunit E [Solirubrobacteraceae bacterium]|jgi:NADH-quinone oxidoreductase subunit E|nr:NAD(P)H-dependent oxidoreductase subunit E [Solirubrobacteraceae bacterium]